MNSFIKLPTYIFSYKGLSTDAKVLYSVMLNRKNLSIKNGDNWKDENGVYIIFSLKEVMKSLECSKSTASRVMNELKDRSLIQKKRVGQGNPDHIYVIEPVVSAEETLSDNDENIPVSQQRNSEAPDGFKSPKDEISKETPEDSESIPKKNESNNNYLKIYLSTYQSNIPLSESKKNNYSRVSPSNHQPDISLKPKWQKDVDYIIQNTGLDELPDDYLNTLFINVIKDTLSSSENSEVKINGVFKPCSVVRDAFLKLDRQCIKSVVDDIVAIKDFKGINNPAGYIRTMLYNSIMDVCYMVS